ncbi:NAD-dependent epimerase/dehydratase family protein [Anaeromicropila populeti]|uniref:Nucleoside-diphosphate-sugar epimerase n=1 Tax=Anaeromicropila populeti TaxID=37658 RepID=A0A1I6HSA8_9FIRM|nr:SDR family oxidoreductase [Anaeromicropila populeti]SFR57303.1 Nucleoside-diphosphate-sugar epimerase [Anaeromicropila populeti]
MKKILMTGISGFLGNALASLFILNNIKISALIKEDIDSERIIKNISLGMYKDVLMENKIRDSIDFIKYENFYDFDQLSRLLDGQEFDEVWHLAAHMSYDPAELVESVTVNSVGSTTLMKAVKECKRFYFISTTGVAGIGSKNTEPLKVPEALLSYFEPTNPYTVSKVLAEYMLFEQSVKMNMPVTIIRPGSIIGSSKTGWVNSTKYGYYSYLYMLKKFKNKNIDFYLNINEHRKFPVIHINHLVELCIHLQNRKHAEDREIFHAINQNLMTAKEHFEIFQEKCGYPLKIKYGMGELGFNRTFNKMNQDNNHFLGVNCIYENNKLAEAIGAGSLPPALTEESIATVMSNYLSR